MAHKASDIEQIEDVGERLDALLDALAETTDRVTRVARTIDAPDDPEELAADSNALVGDDGRRAPPAGQPPSPAADAADPAPAHAPADSGDPGAGEDGDGADAMAASGDAGGDVDTGGAVGGEEAVPDASEGTETAVGGGSLAAAEAVGDEGPDAGVQRTDGALGDTGPTPAADGASADDGGASQASAGAPGGGDSAGGPAGASGVLDDTPLDESELEGSGLLIEPEDGSDAARSHPDADLPAGAPAEPGTGDDGAPAGPADLEEALDEELEALLASGEFEDPLADAAESGQAAGETAVGSGDGGAASGAERRPPDEEQELISELDDQLAALADQQLGDVAADDDQPTPAAASGAGFAASDGPRAGQRQDQSEPEIEHPGHAGERPDGPGEPAQAGAADGDGGGGAPSAGGAAEAVGSGAGGGSAAAKAAEALPAGWRDRAAWAWSRARPVVERASRRGISATLAGCERASRPLRDRPQVRQLVGWVALVQAFFAACVWLYLVLWHNPSPPPPERAQPELVEPSPSLGEGGS